MKITYKFLFTNIYMYAKIKVRVKRILLHLGGVKENVYTSKIIAY